MVQETFLKVLLNRDKYVNQVNFKAWTFTIMKNTFINNYRRNSRHNTHFDHSKELFLLNQTSSIDYNDPDSEYAVLEMTKNIDQLSDIFRIPFKMLLSGYKYQEIAEELHLKVGTIKSRIFLSRKHLMDQLSQ